MMSSLGTVINLTGGVTRTHGEIFAADCGPVSVMSQCRFKASQLLMLFYSAAHGVITIDVTLM